MSARFVLANIKDGGEFKAIFVQSSAFANASTADKVLNVLTNSYIFCLKFCDFFILTRGNCVFVVIFFPQEIACPRFS